MTAGARRGAAAVAAQWRATRPHLDGQGVVVIGRDGEVCGLMGAIRSPDHWKPGCIAVDVGGREWVATGGDDRSGAREWVPVGEGRGRECRVTRSRGEHIAALNRVFDKLDEPPEDIAAALRDLLGGLPEGSRRLVRDEMLRVLENGIPEVHHAE